MNRAALRAAFVFAAAGLCAACRGADYWQDRLQADPLYRRAEKVVQSPSCSPQVPMEYGRTFPVPVAGGRFEMLYYPLKVSPGKSEAMSPAFAAFFSRDASVPDVCAPLPLAASRSVGAPVPAGLSMKSYYRAEAKLFGSLDRTAALYAAGGTPSSSDKAVLGEFADAFTTLAEPGLTLDYYQVNPDFWDWLRRETGRPLPKPGS